MDHIETSAPPHDRREAILKLTDATKESPDRQAQLGKKALKVVYTVLEQDADFDDTVKPALALLIAI